MNFKIGILNALLGWGLGQRLRPSPAMIQAGRATRPTFPFLSPTYNLYHKYSPPHVFLTLTSPHPRLHSHRQVPSNRCPPRGNVRLIAFTSFTRQAYAVNIPKTSLKGPLLFLIFVFFVLHRLKVSLFLGAAGSVRFRGEVLGS